MPSEDRVTYRIDYPPNTLYSEAEPLISAVVSLENLSKSLVPLCEVTEISATQDLYLGILSARTIDVINYNIVKYVFDNYSETKSNDAAVTLEYIRRHIEGNSSKEDIGKAIGVMCSRLNFYGGIDTTIGHGIYSLLYYCRYPYSFDPANAIKECNSMLASKDEESTRQGHYIVDFLKSGRHLFLLD